MALPDSMAKEKTLAYQRDRLQGSSALAGYGGAQGAGDEMDVDEVEEQARLETKREPSKEREPSIGQQVASVAELLGEV